MRKLIITLLLTLSLINLKAQPFPILHYWVGGLAYVVGTTLLNDTPNIEGDFILVSAGIDPKMAVTEGLDLTVRTAYHYNRFEPNIVYEVFPKMEYQSISLGCDYLFVNRELALLSGLEVLYIHNYNSGILCRGFSVGHNTEARYTINEKNSLSLVANIRFRPDVVSKLFVPSLGLRYNRRF